MDNWHHLAFKGQGTFSGQLVGVATNNHHLSPPLAGCLWEFRRFYYHVLSRPLHKWLFGHGRSTEEADGRDGAGEAAVDKIACSLLPGVPAVLVRSSKAQAGPRACTSTSTPNAPVFQEHMVSSGWLLAFVLSFASRHTLAKHKATALSLLEDIVATACGQDDIGTVPHFVTMKHRAVRLWCHNVPPLHATFVETPGSPFWGDLQRHARTTCVRTFPDNKGDHILRAGTPQRWPCVL